MSQNSYLHHFSAQVTQIVFFAYLTILRIITTVWPEMSENSYLRTFSAQVSQIVFLAYLTILRLIYNCMTWNVRKLISLPFQCTSITNRFLTYLTVLRLITTVWPEMSENSYLCHFSPQVSDNVFLSLFEHFTAIYNCITWNVTKLISPPFHCTSMTNRVLTLFNCFTTYYNCMTWNVRKLIYLRF